MPRLLCIYQHAPTPGAPGIYRHRMLLAELVRRGWDVDLVSTPINYMTGVAPEEYRAHAYTREDIEGITHHWVRAHEGVHRSKRDRIRNYLSFGRAAMLRGARLPRPDVVWASSPPLTVGEVGLTLARRFRRPWILEVRDLWPESAASIGWLDEDSRVYRAALRRAKRYARGANAVIVPTPELVERVREHGARDVRVITGSVVDSAQPAAVRAAMREQWGVSEDELVAVYVGAMGAANGLDIVLDAAAAMQDAPIRFVLIGGGGERDALAARIQHERLGNVLLGEPVGKDEIPAILAGADVALHALKPDPTFETALPTKMLEYFGAHLPVITTVPGLPQQIATAAGGSFAPDTDTLASVLHTWIDKPADERRMHGEQAFTYGIEHYGLNANVDRLELLLQELAPNAVKGK